MSAIALPDVEEDSPLRREILTLAEEKGIPLWWVRRDTTVELEKGQLTLYPPLGAGEANELGLSMLAGAGGLDLLVTGDMSGDVEGMLVEHAGLRDVELLVAGHHGSASSTSQALLNALQPETAILSVGRDNAYGHPAPETLERLERAGAEIYRTDRDGTVTRGPGERTKKDGGNAMPPKQKADTAGYQQLKKDLAGGSREALSFHGEETYLRDHYLGRLKELLLTGGWGIQPPYHPGAGDVPRRLEEAVDCLPMMAPRTLVQWYGILTCSRRGRRTGRSNARPLPSSRTTAAWSLSMT